MVPVQFLLTRLGFTSIILILLCLVILIHLLTIRHKSRASWLLIGFYLAVVASIVTMLLANALEFWGYSLAPAQDAWMLVGAAALALFAYHFPSCDQPREARWVTLAFGLMALLALGYSVIFAVRFFLTFSPELRVPEAYYLLFPLVVLLLIGIFLRRSIHYSLWSEPDRASMGSRLRYVGMVIWQPPNHQARGLRNFALALSLGLLPGLAFLPFIPWGIARFMLDFGSIFALAAMALVYLNHAPEPTSVIAKLVGISLVTFLTIFGAIAMQNLTRVEQQFKELLYHDAQQSPLPVLSGDLSAIPATVAYVVTWPPENASGGNDVQRLAYIRPAEPDLDLEKLAKENKMHTGNDAQPFESSRDLTSINSELPRYLDFPPAPLSSGKYFAYFFVDEDTTYEIGFRRTQLHFFTHQILLELFYWLLAGTLVIVLVLPILYRASLVTPLNRLLIGMKRVNRGDLKISVPIQYEDEIGSVTRSFNQMVESLHESSTLKDEYYEELKKAHDEMEQRIAERTEELSVSNEQLIIARNEADAANKAKSAFLAHMSHELRTPLNAILGYTQLMIRNQMLSSDQQQYLTQVQHSGQHLLTLINDVLDLSRIEAGKLALNFSDFSLNGLLADIDAIFRVRAEEKDLAFVCKTTPDLPLMVQGDATRLRQVLLNLLGNAVKFTEEGRVTLSVKQFGGHESTANSEAMIQFSVADSGPGIPTDRIEDIFLPFEQVSSPDAPSKGTGLGLTISRDLVELMGGQLSVESKMGQGTRFWFELLLPIVNETEIRADKPERLLVGYEGPATKVLIVDDIASNRAVLRDMLASLGFEVQEASNGAEGLRVAASFRPDLILIDLIMPGLDGYATMTLIRQQTGLEDVIIFAISASAYVEGRDKSIVHGSDAFIPKPVQFEELTSAIESHLHLKPIYEEIKPGIPGQTVTSAQLIAPPPGLAKDLVESAAEGRIVDLQADIDRLELLDGQNDPLVAELRRLAGGYEFAAIGELLAKTADEPDKHGK